MTPEGWERVAKHYVWEDLRRRAGVQVPVSLLQEIAVATVNEVPAIPDPIAAVEWHIERILTLAALVLNLARTQANPGSALGYTADMPGVAHTYGPQHEHYCYTPLPALLCACNRYPLMRMDPDPADAPPVERPHGNADAR